MSGGYRFGAGRPVGSKNRASTDQVRSLSEVAKSYTEEALQALVDVAKMVEQMQPEFLQQQRYWTVATVNLR